MSHANAICLFIKLWLYRYINDLSKNTCTIKIHLFNIHVYALASLKWQGLELEHVNLENKKRCVSIIPVWGKMSFNSASCCKDQSMSLCLSSEWRGSNLAMADPCGMEEGTVILSSLIVCNWVWGFDRLRVLSGIGFWLTDLGIFHVQSVEVQLWSLPWDDVKTPLHIAKSNPPIWLQAWANLQ